MTTDLEIVRHMCEQCLERLGRILCSVKSLREGRTDATQIDIQVYSEFSELYKEFEASYELLPDEEPEQWYFDDLAGLSMEFDHADHVLGEEKIGLYEFGWPWEECIAQWTRTLKTILERLMC